MYPHTTRENDKLNAVIAEMVMPALQRAIADASRTLVYEVEGFHPDIAYGESLRTAANDIALRFMAYCASLEGMNPDEAYNALCPAEIMSYLIEQSEDIVLE